MNEALLKVAERKRTEILRRVSPDTFKELLRRAEDFWVPYRPHSTFPKSVGGVDGGSNYVDFKGFTLYAVSAVSTVFSREGDDRYLRKAKYEVADVDVLIPPSAGDRLTLLREIAEALAHYLALKEEPPEIMLADGSLRSLLIAPVILHAEEKFQNMTRAVESTEEILGPNAFQELEHRIKELMRDPVRAGSEPFQPSRIFAERGVPITADTAPYLLLMEYVEKLYLLREIIEESFKGARIYYVSKRARAQNYFKELASEGIPLPSDMAVFQYLTDEPGYTKPLVPDAEEGRIRSGIRTMPPALNLLQFFREVYVAITYVRLVKGGPVLKVEFPVKLGSVSEERIKEFMDLSASIASSEGYPYPLYVVDKDARISREDLRRIYRSIGLTPFLGGREVLDEWVK